VVAILLATIASAPSIAGTVTRTVDSIFCHVGQLLGAGGGCSGGSTATPPNRWQPSWPCTQSSDNGAVDLSVTAFDVNLGGKVQYLEEQLSDGRWAATLKVGGQGGIKADLGGNGQIDLGGQSVAGGEGVSGTLDLTGESGAKWYFKDKKAADSFVSAAESNAAWKAGQALAGPAGPLVGLVQNLTGNDFNPPKADEVYFQGGLNGSLTGSLGPAKVTGGLGYAQGGKYNPKTGDVTLYMKVEPKVAVSLGLPVGTTDGSSATLSLLLTKDPTGHYRPKNLTLVTTGMISAGLGGDGHWSSLEDIVKAENIPLGAKDGVGATFTAQLDLTDPQNSAAATRFVTALTGGNPVDPILAGKDLIQRIDQTAPMSLVTSLSTTSSFGGNVEGGAEVTFGLGGHVADTKSHALGAWYRRGGQGFVPWTVCHR
jgi:hypothetical protein